jgi:hypothetical protein
LLGSKANTLNTPKFDGVNGETFFVLLFREKRFADPIGCTYLQAFGATIFFGEKFLKKLIFNLLFIKK